MLPLILFNQCRAPVNGENKIYIFSAPKHNGDLGGKSGAEGMCNTVAAADDFLKLKTIKAFLSVDAAPGDSAPEQVPGANQSWPVYGLNNNCENMIKESWTSLWSDAPQNIDENLKDTVGLTGNWWSGTAKDGIWAESCNAWSSSNFLDHGEIGDRRYLDFHWIEYDRATCDLEFQILCIAY